MNHKLANTITQALIDADTLLWAITAEEEHEDLITKADKVIEDIQEIALTAQNQETDEEEQEEEEHHDYNDIFDNPFEYLEKDLRPPF